MKLTYRMWFIQNKSNVTVIQFISVNDYVQKTNTGGDVGCYIVIPAKAGIPAMKYDAGELLSNPD